MKERPILFSAPMVRALLDGSKTQTRRALRVQPLDILPMEGGKAGGQWVGLMTRDPEPHGVTFTCRHGLPGDRLYVRETWAQPTTLDPGPTAYRADYPACLPGYTNLPPDDHITWKPSIHMPRALSRIMLEVVSVRVERLNDCSEADAKAEGVMQLDAEECQRPEERTKEGWALCPTCCGTGLHSTLGAGGGVNFDVDCRDCDTHLKLYRHLWESINGAGSWAVNPWVWVVEFKRVTP